MTIRQPTLIPPGPERIPRLENGDHLSRDEFERRYEAMPPDVKAELIEGVVYMAAAAVRWTQHSGPHFDLGAWLGAYRLGTPGVYGSSDGTIRLDLENEPQPDVALFINPALGGQARINAEGYIEGAPELVAEVAASTASIDMNKKFRVYRRNLVREYIVWRVLDEQIDWFILRGNEYQKLTPTEGEIYRSATFPGLWLDASAMIRQDTVKIVQTLQTGLASSEHAGFVATLAGRKRV